MSTSAYYNFITTPTDKASSLEAHRRHGGSGDRRASAVSPSSFAASSSSNTSTSSLNQFNSLTSPTSVASSSSSSSSSSSTSSSSSSSSSSFSSCHHRSLQSNSRDLLRQASITPTQPHQLFHSYTLHSLEPKPFKPFKTSSEYLEAMKEDLAEWLNRLYSDLDLTPENFFAQLETGSIICRHANNITKMGRDSLSTSPSSSLSSTLSSSSPPPPPPSSSAPSPNEQQTPISSEIGGQGDSCRSSFNLNEPNNNSPLSSTTTYDSSKHSSITDHNSGKTTTATTTTRQASGRMTRHQSIPRLHPPASLCSLKSVEASHNNRQINWFKIKIIPFKQDVQAGTFFARDNICQFILWCRSLNILECLLFETDDIVARKNEKSFILCLLEVARIGFKVGMPTPLIIQLEQEIDQEIEKEAILQKQLEEKQNQDNAGTEDDDGNKIDSFVGGDDEDETDKREEDCLEVHQLRQAIKCENSVLDEPRKIDEKVEEEKVEVEKDSGPKPQVITNDLVSLHEKVVQLLCQCTCPTQFPMVRVGENGKYKVGDKLIIFVRILRRHIMVRVGGGWQELSEFLRVKDPCRSRLYNNNNNHLSHNHLQLLQQTPTSRLTPVTTTVLKSRLPESIHHLNKGHHNNSSNNNDHHHQQQHPHYRNAGGQRLISGSASMSWLSHNSSDCKL